MRPGRHSKTSTALKRMAITAGDAEVLSSHTGNSGGPGEIVSDFFDEGHIGDQGGEGTPRIGPKTHNLLRSQKRRQVKCQSGGEGNARLSSGVAAQAHGTRVVGPELPASQ